MSVCIVNWNTRSDLQICLEALRTNPFAGGYQEVIVVDNASSDGSVEMVQERFPEVRLIANKENRNYAPGTNQALASATGDYLLLLNPDAHVTEGALDALVRFMNAHPDAGAVAAKLVHEDGTIQQSIRGFPDPLAVLWDLLKLPRLLPSLGTYRQVRFDYEKPGRAAQPMTSCFLLTRAAYEKVGPMDERFPLYFNDMDWCLRAHNADWGVIYVPDAVFTHAIGKSSNHAAERMIVAHHRSMWRFYKKHQAFFDQQIPLALRPLVPVGIGLRVAVRIGRRRYINPLLNLLRGKKQNTSSEKNVQQASSGTH
jgi:GT2 family glycosyltransferase